MIKLYQTVILTILKNAQIRQITHAHHVWISLSYESHVLVSFRTLYGFTAHDMVPLLFVD